MMKKIYQKPTTCCIQVMMQQMVALSILDTTDETVNNLAREMESTEFDDSQWEEEEFSLEE